MIRQRWVVHCCVLDSECRGDIGYCWRIEINSPWWHLGIALRPGDRYAKMDGTADWFSFRRWEQ